MNKIFFSKKGFNIFLIFTLGYYTGQVFLSPWIFANVPLIGYPACFFLYYLLFLFIMFLYWLFIRFAIISPILWIVEKFNKRG